MFKILHIYTLPPHCGQIQPPTLIAQSTHIITQNPQVMQVSTRCSKWLTPCRCASTFLLHELQNLCVVCMLITLPLLIFHMVIHQGKYNILKNINNLGWYYQFLFRIFLYWLLALLLLNLIFCFLSTYL